MTAGNYREIRLDVFTFHRKRYIFDFFLQRNVI